MSVAFVPCGYAKTILLEKINDFYIASENGNFRNDVLNGNISLVEFDPIQISKCNLENVPWVKLVGIVYSCIV